jgi:hypothetical protein
MDHFNNNSCGIGVNCATNDGDTVNCGLLAVATVVRCGYVEFNKKKYMRASTLL